MTLTRQKQTHRYREKLVVTSGERKRRGQLQEGRLTGANYCV